MAKNKQIKHKKLHPRVIIYVIAIVGIVLLSWLVWQRTIVSTDKNIKTSAQIFADEVYEKPVGWTTFVDEELPYTFDYPRDINFKKAKSIADGRSFGYAGYTEITWTGVNDSASDSDITVVYEIGVSGIVEGARAKCWYENPIDINNELTKESTMTWCGNAREWEYEPVQDQGEIYTKVRVMSPEGNSLDEKAFINILKSFRLK